ncbi:nck-associated protein 5 isoform X4 [Petromyzon marinus]|uniref:nck-associated protein 5 isoform X4 n=1 Tax=Petromyzon marinus TaxID=7757 RepID=UPI003F70A73C
MTVPAAAKCKDMDFVKSVVKKGLLPRSQEPMAGERRMDELVGELEVERRNLKREKQAVARLQREVARHRGEGSMRERLMCDLESERRLRLESEKRLQEVTRELTQCRTQLRALRDQFERMEETVQDLMRGQSRVNPPAGKATANGSSAQDVISGPDYTPPLRSADAVIPELQMSGVVGDAGFEEERKKIRALLERLQSLEAQNSALSLENENQRDQYERCLDEVANQVVQALLTQKDLREECLKLRTRVCDLEEQNRSMSILFQQKLRLPSEATLQAGVALGVVEGGALCRGVGSVPTLGRRRHRLVTSSCSSSSEISLSSTCSELSTHSCPWPAEQRESTAGQKVEMRDGRHADKDQGKESAGSEKDRPSRAEEQRRSGSVELGALPSSHEEALKRQQRKEMSILQGLRQLVSREPIPAPDDRNSLRPGEWTAAHRDLMSSNEGIYSPGSKHNDFPGVVAHASVRLRGVQPHQKCSYESDSQEESEDDARGASLDPVPCKEWTLPSCLRLPHSLSDGLFGPGPRAPFPRTPRCVYQVRGVDERIAGYLPRCQSLGKASENWRFGLTANRMQVSLKNVEEPAGRRNGEGGGGGRSTLGAAPGAAFPNISVSLAQSVHKTVTGQVSSLCGQVISLTGQVTTAGDRPRMLQFVKRAAVAAADAPVKPEEEPPGPAVIYDAKDCCPSQLGSGVQTPGAPALHVRGSAKQEVNYTELEPEAASASRAADYAVLESPTEEQPIRDSDSSSGKAAPPAPAGSSTTGNISQVTSGSTSASSGQSHSAAPTLAMSHGAQQRLIKPPYSGGHKSNGLYSAGFAAASSSPSGPRVPPGRMSGKSQSLPQQMKVPCKAGGGPSSGNPPAFRSKSQEKAGGCAPHDKSPGPSSPAKLSRFLKIPSVGSGLGVKSDLANPTRGSPQLPRSSRIPCKSEAAAATKLPNGCGPASPSPEAAPPPGRKPVLVATLSRAAQQAAPTAPSPATAPPSPVLSPEHQEEPVRDSASGGVKPSHLASPPAPPPPGRSASLLIKPNYDIPPSMTLLRPSYDTQQSLLRVRCGKEQQQAAGTARGGAASRLPVGSPTHASKPAVVPRVPQSLHKSQSSVSEGVGYSQTLAHVSSHQQPRPNHASMQQQKLQLPQSQSEGNMTQNQAILSPKRTVNNVTQHTDATKSCLTMKSPVLIESYNALCSNVPERQNHFVANVTTSFTASVRPTNGLNSPPVSSKCERTSDKKELKLEPAHGDPQEVAEALTSVTPPSKEPDRASDAATWASKGVPPCPRPSEEANSPATHGCASSDLDAKPHPGEGPLPSPLSSPATSSGDAEFRDELKGLRGTPQSPGTARPYPKPALGMSGTKVRSQSFSAQPGSRERMPAASSAGELSPKIRTHIITNTAERGIPLSRQSSLTTPEPPRVATPSEQQQQQEDRAATELQLCVLVSDPHGLESAGENGYDVLEAVSESELLKHCAQNFHNVTIVQEAITAQPTPVALEADAETECDGVERSHGSPTKLPSRLPARAEREKISTKPDGPRSPTHPERLDDSLPEDGGHRISPAKVEGVRSPGKLEDFRARQRAPGHRMVPKFDVVRQPKEGDLHRPVMSPEGHGAMSPEGHGAMSPEGHRAMSPEGHRAMSPEGHRAMSPEGHRAMSPEGHRAMIPEGHKAMSPEGHRAMSPEGHRAMSPEGHRAMSPEGHRAMSPDGHRAMSPEGHRAMSPDGHRAMCPEGHRAMSPEGHGAMSPEGHRAMSPEGHRGVTKLEEQRNAMNAKLPRAKLESPRAMSGMESVRLAQNVKTPKMHEDIDGFDKAESSEGQNHIMAGEGECDGFSINGKGLILQERDASKGTEAPGQRQLKFAGTRTGQQQQQQQLYSPHYGAKSPTKSNLEAQPESPRRLGQALSPQGSAAGPSIEEKVMQGIQANMLRKEQQGVSRAGASTTETKPKSGAASSIASWFGFRRHKTAATAAAVGTAAGTATPAKKMEAPTGDVKKAEVEKQEPKKAGEGKAEVQRKEEKKEWAPLSRRLKPRGKRVEGKQPADKPAPDAQGSRSSPDGSARHDAHGGGGVDGAMGTASSPSSGEFLQEILSRVEKRTMSPNRAPEDSGRKLDPTLRPPHRALLPPDKQPMASPVESDSYGLSLVGLLKGPGRGSDGELLGVWRQEQEEEESSALQLSEWSPKIPRRQPNHLGRVGEGGDGSEATLTLETALAGESARSHAAGFHCQMRTLDSGIGTFPPPDPSGRGVGRSSSRRGAKPESHNTLQQPHNAMQFTDIAPPAASPGSARRALPPPSQQQQQQQQPRATFQPPCQQPAAPVHGQPGAPAGGGGRGVGMSGGTGKAKTLDRETAPGVGGGGGCVGDGADRMSHSLSDPSMAARASRAVQSRLPKPVIAVPVKLPAAAALGTERADGDDDDDEEEEEEEAVAAHRGALLRSRAPALGGRSAPLGLKRLPLAMPQQELALPDVFLTESSSGSGSEDESEEGGVVMPRPLGAPSTDIYAKLQRANRVMRKHLVLPSCTPPAPISLADAFHHGSYQRAPCRPFGERTTIVPFDLLMEGEEEEDDEEGEGDGGGQRAAAGPDGAFPQQQQQRRRHVAAVPGALGPGVVRSPRGPAASPKDGGEESEDREGEDRAGDDASFASGKATGDNVESLSDSLYDSFSSTASQLSNEA